MEDLPDGVSVQNGSVKANYGGYYHYRLIGYNYTLTLSIVNTTLNGSLICESDETNATDGMAGCLVVGKFETAVLTSHLYSALCRMTCLLWKCYAKLEIFGIHALFKLHCSVV